MNIHEIVKSGLLAGSVTLMGQVLNSRGSRSCKIVAGKLPSKKLSFSVMGNSYFDVFTEDPEIVAMSEAELAGTPIRVIVSKFKKATTWEPTYNGVKELKVNNVVVVGTVTVGEGWLNAEVEATLSKQLALSK